MEIVCSPAGLSDNLHPVQGIGDVVQAGFREGVLDFSIVCSGYRLEKHGSDHTGMRKAMAAIDDFLAGCAAKGLRLPIASAPCLKRDTIRKDDAAVLTPLIYECLRYCAQADCHYLVVRPLGKGLTGQSLWRANQAFYLSMLKDARKYGVTILLENSCRNISGHFIRGACADGAEAAAWVDQLNEAAGEERFAFCLNMEAAGLCGQSLQELAVALGHRLRAVFLTDGNGLQEQALLPFTGACKRQSQTDWLGMIRGLRAVNFDGMLVLAMRDTAAAISPLLRPALMRLAKAEADYISWQIQMEEVLHRYPSVVLFGAGNMCRNYMKCYGAAYPPLFTCDNNEQRWGTEFCGLMVRPPEALKSLPKDCAILICNVYYREIEEQLRGMGIRNTIAYFNDEYLPQFEFTRLKRGRG